MGQFKQRYPQVHSMGDAGELLMGPIGREVFYVGQLLFIIFLMASHILTFSVLFNTITNHGTCTIVFGVIGLIVSCIAALPRTAEKVFYMSTISAISILVATIVTMISIGVQAPDNVQNDIITAPTFQEGFLAVTNIVFAFIAHVSFFGIMSEMQDPKDFPKALAMLQIVDTTMYIVTAMVIYCYAGPDVSSPALSSAGPVMKKVAYGLAIPTVIVAGVVFGHVACKYIYVRIFRGERSHHMHQKSLLATGTWVAIGLTTWTVAWVIAESIPVFNELLSLISSLFGSWFSCKFIIIQLNVAKILTKYRRNARYLLAQHEQGAVVLKPSQDRSDHSEPCHSRNCYCYCMFFPILHIIDCLLTLLVWIGPVRLGRGYQRELLQCQLDLRQQRHLNDNDFEGHICREAGLSVIYEFLLLI